MFDRASRSICLPFRSHLIHLRPACSQCCRYAPSNPAMPPIVPEEPSYHFQSICADFFSLGSKSYLVVVDRYSNWFNIFKLTKDTTAETLTQLRHYITMFGIPVTLTTDGAKVFTSQQFEDFCSKWGIVHRVSSGKQESRTGGEARQETDQRKHLADWLPGHRQPCQGHPDAQEHPLC